MNAGPLGAGGRRLVLTGLVWFLAFVYLSIGAAEEKMAFPLEAAARRGAVCLAGAVICWLMGSPIERLARAFSGRMVLALVFSVPASLILGAFNAWVFSPMFSEIPNAMDFIQTTIYVSHTIYFVFLAWSAIYLMIGYEREAQEKSLALAVAENYALEAQNQMLRYQVNPHFLFNTLNALSTLVLDRRNDAAERVILALSRFLRHSLEKSPGDKIPLSEELAVQREYLAIERIRFPDRLRVDERIDETVLDARVPSLVLQPLIENAVKYAVAPSPHPVTISITARAVGDLLRIDVIDDGTAPPPPGTPRLGIGLRNVSGRLLSTYGAAAILEAGGRPEGGFAAILTLPLERS